MQRLQLLLFIKIWGGAEASPRLHRTKRNMSVQLRQVRIMEVKYETVGKIRKVCDCT